MRYYFAIGASRTTTPPTMTTTPECEGALADLVLQAARAVVTSHPNWAYTGNPWKDCGTKNPPLLTLLDCLIDASVAVAKAINDNAWDDGRPVPAFTASAMADEARLVAEHLICASTCEPCPIQAPSFSETAALELV